MVRATNWVGDAIMALPALHAIRSHFPGAELTVVARPWVADIYRREPVIDRVIPYPARTFRQRIAFGRSLARERFDCAILLQNAFDAAVMVFLARIPRRIGYARDGRSWLLTDAIPVPAPGETPRHQRFYYLELLRRIGLFERYPVCPAIRLSGADAAREAGLARLAKMDLGQTSVLGVSPGAAFGNAKRWWPERFAEAAVEVAHARNAAVLVFGSPSERHLAKNVTGFIRKAGVECRSLAGDTSLREFIELAAACGAFLTNDSGAMHIVSALGVPTVTVFGATDDTETGPTGPHARVLRAHAECAPCLLRECPIDHRCMTGVTAARVTEAVLELWPQGAA